MKQGGDFIGIFLRTFGNGLKQALRLILLTRFFTAEGFFPSCGLLDRGFFGTQRRLGEEVCCCNEISIDFIQFAEAELSRRFEFSRGVFLTQALQGGLRCRIAAHQALTLREMIECPLATDSVFGTHRQKLLVFGNGLLGFLM